MNEGTKPRKLLLFATAFSFFVVLGIVAHGYHQITGLGTAQDESPLQRLEKLKSQLKEKNYAGSEKMAREILAEVEALYGENSLEAARVLDVLVDSILGSFEHIYRKEYSEKRRQAKTDEEHNALRQGIKQKSKQVRAESLALAERSLSIKEQVLGHSHPEIAKSWNDFVIQYGGRPKELLDRALKMSEEAFHPDHPEVSRILYQFGRLYFYGKEVEKAREPLERALRINESAFGPEHVRVAQVLDEYTRVLADAGQFSEARSLQERAIRIREKDPELEYVDYRWSVEVLRIIFRKMGAYDEIIVLLEQSLPFKEKLLGPEHPDFLRALRTLADEYMDIYDYLKARTILQRIVSAQEKIFGKEDERVLMTLNSLAITHYMTGDYDNALALYKRILVSEETSLVLENLAILYRDMGDYDQEKACLVRINERYEDRWGDNPPGDAAVWNLTQWARISRKLGNFDKALELQKRALAYLEKIDRQDFQMVDCLFALALIYRDIGDGKEALALIERAMALQEKLEGPNHPNTAWRLYTSAECRLMVGQMDEAFDEALRSGEIAHNHIRLMASSLSERGTLAYAASKTNSFDICLSLAASHDEGIGKFVTKAWDYLIRSRALVFDEMSARHRTTLETSDPEIKALADSFFAARRSLANLVVRGPSALDRGENYRSHLDKLNEKKEQAERKLAQASIAFRKELERSSAGLDEIKSSLPPGFSLVAFARYNHYRPSALPSNELRQIPSYVAFVLQNSNSEPTIVPLGTEEEIEPLVFDWGQEAARGTRIPGRSAKDSEAAYYKAGEALRQKLWDPVAPHLEKATYVLVVPDGILHTVNFACLPVEPGKYLIENRPLIHYLSAERDIVSSEQTTSKGMGLLALGDPAFDETKLFSALSPEKKPKQSILSRAKSLLFRGSRSGCGDFRSMRFAPLPAAHEEIQNVTDIWTSSQQNNGDVLKLTGDMASEEAFKIAAPGRQILHLATHGFFIEGDCPSALKQPDKNRGSGGDVSGITPVIGENPLLLSGLALAGANNREAAGPDEEDGILTAEEVAALDLSGNEWVVLSACDTGVGKIKPGEGIFGLRRAFRQAGAQTLITSLWPVEDEAALKWMKALYKARFNESLGTAEAVHKAYLDVLQELRKKKDSTHPFYWAGFVASGDWR